MSDRRHDADDAASLDPLDFAALAALAHEGWQATRAIRSDLEPRDLRALAGALERTASRAKLHALAPVILATLLGGAAGCTTALAVTADDEAPPAAEDSVVAERLTEIERRLERLAAQMAEANGTTIVEADQ